VGEVLADQWEWDGARWTDITPAVVPSPRHHHGMAWNGERGDLLIFVSDTWLLRYEDRSMVSEN